MNQEKQDKFKVSLVEKYEQAAFEALAMYDYHGRQYATVEKQVEDMEKRIEECQKAISEIEALPDNHTVENRNRIKALRKDIGEYEQRIKSVGEVAEKMFKESVGWREKGVRLLEQAEHILTFTLRTPEQIEADKAKPSQGAPEETKVEANAEVKS